MDVKPVKKVAFVPSELTSASPIPINGDVDPYDSASVRARSETPSSLSAESEPQEGLNRRFSQLFRRNKSLPNLSRVTEQVCPECHLYDCTCSKWKTLKRKISTTILEKLSFFNIRKKKTPDMERKSFDFLRKSFSKDRPPPKQEFVEISPPMEQRRSKSMDRLRDSSLGRTLSQMKQYAKEKLNLEQEKHISLDPGSRSTWLAEPILKVEKQEYTFKSPELEALYTGLFSDASFEDLLKEE
ncbi:hypothetical protein EDD86DRAFT_269468 [Gorgonomyces haynaldii]|nr:hypothetical protein EDD86DRAFT_269468 [Gorgonomyces haynaldii]